MADDYFRIRIVSTEGIYDEVVPDWTERSLAGSHQAAIRHYLQTGQADRLADFDGIEIGGLELETDPDVIDFLDDSGELDGDLYPARRADLG